MTDDPRDTGMPTRAIHESYLRMQESHTRYRRARDNPNQSEKRAHAGYQEAVLTFHELIRSHIKRKGAMGEFWYGELPDYPEHPWQSVEHAIEYCRQSGTAIWGLQKHYQTVSGSPNVDSGSMAAATDGGVETLADWHDRLNLGDMQRVVKVSIEDSGAVTWLELRAVAGLRQLDNWDTTESNERQQGSGFMSSTTSTATELKHVPIWKLTKAKRLLAEATDKMNLLSHVEVDHEDGAIVNFDQSRDDVEPAYRTADYDSSPDI